MNYALYAIAGLLVLNTLTMVARIGKPRPPITPRDAVTIVIIDAAIIVIIVLAALQLS